MRSAGVFCFILFFCQNSFSQNIKSFEIKDQDTHEPIEHAFIFIENTSIGTTTDRDGKAILDLGNQSNYTIVITHLLYENYILSHTQLRGETLFVSMVSKTLTLDEVTVKTKKSNQKKRKRWIKKFEKAFIGEKVSARKVKFLNPEAIWFEETDSTLNVYAVDNLKLWNKEMGYRVLIALEEFSISIENDIKYVGKLFFDDIKEEQKNQNKIDERREKSYLESRHLFFRSLIQRHPINEKLFEYGITSISSSDSLKYSTTSFDELNWKYGSIADTLLLPGYLTVINKYRSFRSFVSRGASGKSYKNTPATTFLKSKSGRFIISHDGYLLNQREVEESGYWTSFRMAMELPKDYKGGIIFNSKNAKISIDKILHYPSLHSPEKVYLHTNKNYFTPYETLWIKGYLVDGVDHKPSTKSAVVYIDLIDSKSKIVKTWLLHKDKDLRADYTWHPKQTAGEYRLRAYTNHMRNQGSDFFFEKIISLQSLTDGTSIQTSEALIKENKALDIAFFPEGGDLINGLTSQVAFLAKDESGQIVKINGKIETKKGKIITEVKSTHKGMGLFHITPHNEEEYVLTTKYHGEIQKYDLPNVFSSGLSIGVNPTRKDEIFITIGSSNNELLKNAYIIGHVRGNLIIYESDLENAKSLKIAKSSLPSGIIHLTLFDGQDRPQAERLFFNDHNYEREIINVTTDRSNEKLKNEINLLFQLDSNLIADNVDISAKVNNKFFQRSGEEEVNIKNYLLLQSDLFHIIPNIQFYLKDISKAKRYYLDLILRCSEWRRFTWKDQLNNDSITFKYPFEQGYTISGHSSKKENSDPVRAKIMINSLDSSILFDHIVTDDQGVFSFTNLPYFDTISYIIQGRIDDGKIESSDDISKIDGNRLLDIHLDSISPTISNVSPSKFYEETQHQSSFSENQMSTLKEHYRWKLENDTSIWSLDIDEIQITTSRPYTTNRTTGQGKFYNLDYADWVAPELSGTRLLTKIAPSRSYYSGAEGKLYSIIVNRKGEIVYVPMQIIVDGMGYEPGGSNALPFLNLTADQIETIYVGKAFVEVRTRSMSRSREKYLDSGIIHFTHLGYTAARAFSRPNSMSSKYHSNETVFWDPHLPFDEHGKANITFDSEDDSSSYIIKLEGISDSGKIINYRFDLSGAELK